MTQKEEGKAQKEGLTKQGKRVAGKTRLFFHSRAATRAYI